MSSSEDTKLPTSTLARSFSAQLNDIFLLDESLNSKEKEVEQKKLELTQQNAELEALEARLKLMESTLTTKRNRMSLIEGAPTPVNTEVGNPLEPVKSPRRRTPIPNFAAPTDDPAEEGEGGINNEGAPEPPKKDDPVALQAPRALPGYGGEIEAWKVISEKNGVGGGGGWREGENEYRGDVITESNTTKIASTTASANVDVPNYDKIEIYFNQKEQPKLPVSDGQGAAWQTPHPQHPKHNAPAAAQPALLSPTEQNHENRRSDPQNHQEESHTNANAAINGRPNLAVKPDEDGDEHAAGNLIDQYGADDDSSADSGTLPGTEQYTSGSNYAKHSNVSLPIDSTNQLPVERTLSPVSRSSASRSDPGTEVNSVLNVYASTPSTPAPPAAAQESANVKYIAGDFSFQSRPVTATGSQFTAQNLKTELPPLPGQTSQIPKRKPLRSSEEASRPAMSVTAAEPAAASSDRPPTPPSKAPRSVVNVLSSQYNNSDLSLRSNSPVNRLSPSIAPTEHSTYEKPLPPPSDEPINMPREHSRESGERGFGGLLKMKKSLQGLRKKAQNAAASPISPSNDTQRNYSPTSSSYGYPTPDPRTKDEPPLPPIPVDKLPPGVTLQTISYQAPPPPPPQAPPSTSQPDIFDRVQAQQQQWQQQQQFQQQQQQDDQPKRFEAKHKKAVEAIAKFSTKMSALRSLRKKDGREEEQPVSQEPPLAPWEIEQRARANQNAPGYPISLPQTAYPGSPPPTSYPAVNQTWNLQQAYAYDVNVMSNNNNMNNNYAHMSSSQSLTKEDELPPPPPNKLGEDLPPPTPSKFDPMTPQMKELPIEVATQSEAPYPQVEQPAPNVEKHTRTPSKPAGFSIFPSSSTSRPIIPEAEPPAPPTKYPNRTLDLTKEIPPAEPFKPVQELPPPPPEKFEPIQPEVQPPAPEKVEIKKPAHLQLGTNSNHMLEKPQPSPGLLAPVSPGYVPGRGGRTETYSFLGDYYFTDNPDGEEAQPSADYASSAAVPPSPRSPLPAVAAVHESPIASKRDSDAKMNFRIKSFAPFSLGDFGSSLSFDSFQAGGPIAEEPTPPVPPIPANPVHRPIPAPVQSAPPVVSMPAPISAPISTSSSAPPIESIPPPPVKDERKSPAIPDSTVSQAASTPEKKLPDAPKTVQRVPSKSELRDKYPTPLQTVAHRSILTSSVPNGRQSEGSPPLPMKDIPEEGPYPASKPSPLSTDWSVAPPNTQTSATTPVSKAGYASGVSSVRSSGYTESPSATASTPRTSLSSAANGSTAGGSAPSMRVTSGEQQPQYPARNSSQGYSQQGPPRPPSGDAMVKRPPSGGSSGPSPNMRPPNMHGGPPPPRGRPDYRGPPPGPGGPGGPGTPEMRGRPGFRPPPGGPMGPGYPPRSSSPAFSERSMRPRGPPPPRSSSPAFSERSMRHPRGPPPPRSASPAFSMRGDPRMPMHGGPGPRGPPPPHQRKRSNSMEVLDFAVDFELPSTGGKRQEFRDDQRRRSRSESIGYGSRPPPPGAFRGRAESPAGFRPGSRAGSRGPPGMPPPPHGPGSRPGSRTQSPFGRPPPPHHFNGPPRGGMGSRRNSNASSAGGGNGSRRLSMSEADLDIALGMGQLPGGQERKYRPPPQMRGGKMPPGGPPGPGGPGGGRGMAGRIPNPGGVTYPGLDDGYSMMDSGRMPGPSMPRREEMT